MLITFILTSLILVPEGILAILKPRFLLELQFLILKKLNFKVYGVFMILWGNMLIYYARFLDIYKILYLVFSGFIILSGLTYTFAQKEKFLTYLKSLLDSNDDVSNVVLRIEGMIKMGFGVLLIYILLFEYNLI